MLCKIRFSVCTKHTALEIVLYDITKGQQYFSQVGVKQQVFVPPSETALCLPCFSPFQTCGRRL